MNHCPLCNSTEFDSESETDLLICLGCSEMLYPSELVRRATRKTKREYNSSNPGA